MGNAVDLQRAEVLLDLQRWGAAAELLSGLLAANPGSADAWVLFAVACLGVEEPDRALWAAGQASAVDAHDEWPQRLASIAAQRLDRLDEAVASARAAVHLGPDVWAAHAQLAAVLGNVRSSRREAETAARRAVELAPDEPAAHLVLAAVLGEDADPDAAEGVRRALVRRVNPAGRAGTASVPRARDGLAARMARAVGRGRASG